MGGERVAWMCSRPDSRLKILALADAPGYLPGT